MRKKSKHKATTVLFADIVGYTTLMQSEEQKALAQLQYFKEILEETVGNFNGKIIQYYGDGCLITFEKSLAALSCAKKLQASFQRKYEIPVRIGLHKGVVIFKDDNVYGHAVNVASRVESLGIAGAVLMTATVFKEVKHSLLFKLAPLGAFEFKNVKESLSIYALANHGFPIPKRKEMQGKLKEKNNKYAFLFWLIPTLIAALFGWLLWQNHQQSRSINNEIREARIAVLPFINQTNDPNLNDLGDLAADWINQSLMGVDGAEVVSPYTIRTHKAAIGILGNDPENRPSFAQLTGAQNLITGSFYKNKEQLIFRLELVNALDGKLRFSFDEIKGKETQKEALLARLRSEVTGYWAAKEFVDAKKIAVPNFEAYKLYLEILQKRGTEADLLKILTIDSTFYLARIHFLNIQKGTKFGAKAPHFEFLDRHINQLSAYEKGWFAYLKEVYLGNPIASFESLNTLRQKYPKDFLLNHSTANIALNGLHNPELALAIYRELPLEATLAKAAGVYWNERLLNMVTCFIELDRLQAANDLLNTAVPNPGIDNNIYLKTRLVEALTGDNIGIAYEQLKATLQTRPFYYFWVNIELIQSNLLPNEFREQQEADLVNAYRQLSPMDINRITWQNFIAIATNDASFLSLENLERLPKGLQIGNLAAAGQFYINAKQPTKIPALIDRLQTYTTCDYSGQVSTICGAAYYYIGLLQAQIGQTAQAIENLRRAKKVGLGNELHRFQYARYLTSLFDLPAFQDLIQPIWPYENDGEVFVSEAKEFYQSPNNLIDITEAFKQKRSVQLASANHFFRAKLGMTNNYSQQKVIFQYQLPKLAKEWVSVERDEVTIGNLPFGEQLLRIKAQYPNGQFSKKIVEIPIIIPRPFYLNIWFLAIVLVVIFLGVYFLPSQGSIANFSK